MDYQEIFTQVAKIIASELRIQPERILAKSNIVADFGADSIDMASILCDIEEEFDIYISDDEIESRHTVGEWVKLIQGKKVLA